MLGACDRAGGIPAEVPPGLQQPAKYAWGDAIAARDDRLARHVTRHLADRYGRAREARYVAADPAALRSASEWYRERLGPDWSPAPLEGAFGPGEAGFGFARGTEAVVVAWLAPQPDGRFPVTIFRFEADAGR